MRLSVWKSSYDRAAPGGAPGSARRCPQLLSRGGALPGCTRKANCCWSTWSVTRSPFRMMKPTPTSDLRREVDQLIAAGSADLASASLSELWREEAGTAVAPFLVSRFEQLRGKIPLVPLRIVCLRSFTVEPAVPLLRAEAFVRGIDLSVKVGDFNAFA